MSLSPLHLPPRSNAPQTTIFTTAYKPGWVAGSYLYRLKWLQPYRRQCCPTVRTGHWFVFKLTNAYIKREKFIIIINNKQVTITIKLSEFSTVISWADFSQESVSFTQKGWRLQMGQPPVQGVLLLEGWRCCNWCVLQKRKQKMKCFNLLINVQTICTTGYGTNREVMMYINWDQR